MISFFKTKKEKDYESVNIQDSLTLETLKILERTIDRLENENRVLRERINELENQLRSLPVSNTNVINPEPFKMPSLNTMSDAIRKLESRSRDRLKLIQDAQNKKEA